MIFVESRLLRIITLVEVETKMNPNNAQALRLERNGANSFPLLPACVGG